MNVKTLRANFMLILAAFLWGSTFVAQSIGNDLVGPFTFQASRCLLGSLVLLPVAAVADRFRRHKYGWRDRSLWTAGILCGLILFIATNLQQFGLQYTSVGKSGFITALYIVLVPILGLALHKRPGKWVWLAVALATGGLYLLCITETFTIGLGDLLTLLCALCFSVHILVIDYFSPKTDGIRLSCLQFLVCGLLSAICAVCCEPISLQGLFSCRLPIAYAGICSCGIAYTFQILAQKDTDPTVASLLMSMESLFATLSAWLVLHETLAIREYIGCMLMCGAIVLAQLPASKTTTV